MINRRLTWLSGIILLWGLLISGKLISLQVLHHRKYLQMARRRQELVIPIPAPRATIFDRTSHMLAVSVPIESVYVNPLHVPDLNVASALLSSILKLDRSELDAKLTSAFEAHRGFLWIKRRISFEEGQRLRSLHLEWLNFQSETKRQYPNGSLAAHIIGSVDFEERGNAGVERALDGDLQGQPGQARLLTDVKRRGIDFQTASEPHAGTPIVLSIDPRIQFVAEQKLAMAVQDTHALRGSLVVMNPQNGEILAMASFPSYDPNQPPLPGEPVVARQNQAIEAPFEPGSVFKVITLAAALETTNLRPETMINCGNGTITLFGRTIHEAKHGYGTIPMEMVLAKSSNIGAIQVGMRVGEDKLKEYVRRFGFGRKTGISLPAESNGKVRKKWGKTSLSSVAMGHEISTTTLQLAQACSVIANGGLLVRPRIVIRKGDIVPRVEPPQRVIAPETAITMRRMMEGVVLHGTGTKARLVGYRSGGKTGSAQIYDFAAGHFTHSYNASFMGFAPVTNPALVIVVTLNGTHGSAGFGGPAAAPVFRTVAMEALRILDVPKDLPDESPDAPLIAENEDVDDLAIADLGSTEPSILAEGEEDSPDVKVAAKVQGPALPPAALASVAQTPVPPAVPAGPTVPDFHGMTMRAVLASAAERGLAVLPNGSGIARIQSPPAGAVLREGERIRVQFAR